MSFKNAMDQLEKLMEYCSLPNTADSYQKYIEKIRDLYSQLSQRLSLKINVVRNVEEYGPADESLELPVDDLNWSAENEEKMIAGFQEKCAHQETVIAAQKKFLKSFGKSLKMLSALERLYQIPLKLVIEFQATSLPAELKFKSEVKPLMDEAAEIEDKQLLEPIVTDIRAKIGQFKADIETCSSSSWILSGLSQLQAVKEGLRLVETERKAVLEKFAVLESWRTMQTTALNGKRDEMFMHVKRLEESVQEKKVMLPLMIAMHSMLVENQPLAADDTKFIRLHREYVEMRIETFLMMKKTNETDPRFALALLNKSL